MQWVCAAVFLLLGTAWCLQELPENLQILTEKFGGSLSIEEVQEAVKSKCEKNGGLEAYDKLKTAKDNLQTCIQANFDLDTFQEEIEEKKKTGEIDEVFAKYCHKVPTVKECVKSATVAIENCLEENEKSGLKLLLNITDSLVEFACFKDGDRLAMFVAEGGPECIKSKQDELQRCANETLSHRIPTDFSVSNFRLPLLADSTEGCDDYAKIHSCAVTALEACDDSTPANIVDALFRFIKKMSPCKSR